MSQQQTCILVLGMHRSGTSALTGFLNIFGLSAGKQLMSAESTQNAKGFFENQKVVDLNQNELFELLKIDWDSLYTLKEDWHLNPSLDYLYLKAKDIIQQDYQDSNTFLIKDPRICILFPFWEKVFLDLNIDIKIVLPFRNPIEVAKSLETRDNFALDKSLLLWTKYVLYAEYYSRNYHRIFTSFNNLMDNPHSVYENLLNILDIDLPYSYDEKKQEVTDFLDSNLKHHNRDVDLENINIEITQNTTKLFLQQLDHEITDLNLLDQLRSQYSELIDTGLEIKIENDTLIFDKFNAVKSTNNLAIIIHLYYIDLWDELNSYLEKLPSMFDIYITTTPQYSNQELKELKTKLNSNTKLILVENRGRDVLPFLKLMQVIGLKRYQYICKLHSKKSLHVDYGDEWRSILFDYLLGSQEIVSDIISQFDNNKNISMITGLNLITPSTKSYEANKENLQLLFTLAGITYTKDFHFAAGTMFWIRSQSLYPIEKLLHNIPIFEEEKLQTDGTLAHAFERLFGFLCEYQDQKIIENTINFNTNESYENEKFAICKRIENNAHLQYKRVVYRDHVILNKNRQLETKEQIILKKDQLLNAKDQTILKREAVIANKNEQLNAKDQTILKREAVIANKNEQLKAKDQTILKREAVIANKNEQLKAKDQTILKRQAVITQRDEQLQVKERLIRGKNEQLKAKDQTILKRQAVIAQKDKQLKTKDEQIKELQLSLENYKTQLYSVQKEYAAIYNSKSYKMTRPLRQLKRKLKGFFSK